jgi:hypothetical protein
MGIEQIILDENLIYEKSSLNNDSIKIYLECPEIALNTRQTSSSEKQNKSNPFSILQGKN